MKQSSLFAAAAGLVCLASGLCFALVMTDDKGTWPVSWPKELEPLRARAKTVCVAHGIQENVYEIPFADRAEFEQAWPHLLKLKSKGAPIILERSPSTYSVSGSMLTTGVRILWPSGGTTSRPGGAKLEAGAPWPAYLTAATGELPEYVTVENDKWVPATADERKGFLHRVRVDIVLVTDGRVIDLNRIELPAGTSFVDHRFAKDGKGAVCSSARVN
jgi:hypothetical protein